MAFGSNIIKRQEVIDEQSDVEQQENNFLMPTKDAKKDSLNDPYGEELTKKAAYQYTMKTLNAIKIVSPIITALMSKPGIDATNEELLESFRELIKDITEISTLVCEKIGVDPNKEKNYWIRNVLEKSFAEFKKDQWVANKTIDNQKIALLIDEVVKFSQTTVEKWDYEESDPISALHLANFRAIIPVISEAKNNFDLYRNFEDDIEPIMKKLYEAASEAVSKLADSYASIEDRSRLFSVLIQEAGVLYSNCWHAEGVRVEKIMNSYAPEKLEKALEKHKSSGGLPLHKIEQDFDKYFNKMLMVSQKLVASQKSGLDKKLKIKK